MAESFAGRQPARDPEHESVFSYRGRASGGYYWPIYSLGLLGIVEVLLLLPLSLNRRLWFHLVAVSLWLLAGWFLVFRTLRLAREPRKIVFGVEDDR